MRHIDSGQKAPGTLRRVCLFGTALLLLALGGCAPRGAEVGQGYQVTVEAGAHDRRGTPVAFAWPSGLDDGAYVLRGMDGADLAVQPDGEGQAWFVLDDLAAGQARTYRLVRLAGPASEAGVTAERDGRAVELGTDGRLVFQYNGAEALPRPDIDPVYTRGGYVHPVLSPSGLLVTDDFPPNHLHHHGIWAAWTNTRFQGREPDFWNMGEKTGTVRPVRIDTVWEGSVHGGVRARHQYVDLSATPAVAALDEEWELRLFDVSPGADSAYLFDLQLHQTTATDSALFLPEYLYGGVGFRGNRAWDGAENTFFLTSEGKTRVEGHATRTRWVHISGLVEGRKTGVAILSHSGNFRAPQPVRIHPREPFFNYAPSQAGDFAIRPGEPFILRYRYVVSDGEPDPDELDRLWYDYAEPPTVSVTRL